MSSKDLNLENLWKVYLGTLNLNANADGENTNPEDIKDDMELLNLLKGYLVQCAEKVLDNPEELVREVLKARDEEIKDLKKEIESLKKEVEELKWRDMPIGGMPYPEPKPWTTSPYYPWSTSSPGFLPPSITYSTDNANEAKG